MLHTDSLFLRLYRSMLDQLPDGVLLVEVDPLSLLAVTLEVNQTLLQQGEFTREELIGQPPPCLESPLMHLAHRLSLQNHLRDHTPFTFQVEIPRGDRTLWREACWTPLEGPFWMVLHRDTLPVVQAQLERISREQQLDQLLEHAESMLRIMNHRGKVQYVSPSCEHLFGYTPQEFSHLPLDQFIHPEDCLRVQRSVEQRLQQGAEVSMEVQDYRVLCKDGSVKWVSTVSRTVPTGPGELDVQYHLTTVDVTARKQAELDAQKQVEQYQALLDLTYWLETLHDPDELARDALAFLLPLSGYEVGSFDRRVGDHLETVYVTGKPLEPFQTLHEALLPTLDVPLLGRAFAAPGPVFYETLSDHPLQSELARAYPGMALLPIRVEGDLIGVLVLASRTPGEVSEGTRKLCHAVEERLSLAFSRLSDLEHLREAREETLRAMGLVLEYRDFETKGHTDRVVDLSIKLGEKLGLSAKELDDLRVGAYLHDVGKVAVPDMVLLKPGKLTPEEWDFIRKHPSVGYELLHHIPTLPMGALEVVLYHQERWNGSGYPEGLQGEEIPLLARIFAVVDVYDALTSERPYKRAWSPEEAAGQLLREAGTLLDRQVVEAFLKVDPAEG